MASDEQQTVEFRPRADILELGPGFYDAVAPAAFPERILRFRNRHAAAEVGLDGLSDSDWLRHFAAFEPLPGSLEQPLALRYHGHQFRTYNPDIGDGRGFLFAQMLDARGRLLDLGTKGSGQTPYSRFGDGRLTLKGGVREVLATEMLEALGVETSRSFSLVETGEELVRGDEPSPTRSAVLVRLSHGHVRIGSFQRLATLQDEEGLARLTAYALDHLLALAPADEDAPVVLLQEAVRRTARLAASYMAAGFVHGVLNSDNLSITAESFDYGPWRFAPTWQPGFTAAYFDAGGLYAFGRQPEALHWNLWQLALSLSPIVQDSKQLQAALEAYPALFEAAFVTAILRRLGVAPRDEASDLALADAWVKALRDSQAPLDRAFFDWRGGRRRRASPSDAHYDGAAFAPFVAAIGPYETDGAADHPYWSDSEPCAMLIDEVEAIWAPIAGDDDWGPFEAKIAAIRRMGEALALS